MSESASVLETSEGSPREQELLRKLGDRSMMLFFVAFIACLELLVIFQLTHPQVG